MLVQGPIVVENDVIERREVVEIEKIRELGGVEPFGQAREPPDVSEQDAYVQALRQQGLTAPLKLGENLFRNELLEPFLDVVLPDLCPQLIILERLRQETVDPSLTASMALAIVA